MSSKPDLTILWLDDNRNPNIYFTNPNNTSSSAERNRGYYNTHVFPKYNPYFVWVKSRSEFQDYIIKHGLPDMISFDHDVKVDPKFQEYNGTAIAKWLVEYCRETNQPLPWCYVHSANTKRIPIVEDILSIPHIPLIDKKDSKMKNSLPTWDEKKAIEEANEFVFSKSLRVRVYANNCKIIKANGYQTSSNEKVVLADKERLQKETVAYSMPTDVSACPVVTEKTQTGVFEADCLLVAKALSDKGWNPAVLNLADEKSAGGFVHKGMCAQEEELSRRTTLTESLFPIHSEEYGKRIGLPVANIAYPMNKDWGGIYSPNVTVFRDVVLKGYALLDKPYSTSIISVAAVKDPTIDKEKLEIKMPKAIEREKNKMRTILRIGLLHGHDSLVLGAFGCGAFHTPPSHIARLFAEVFDEPEFRNKYKGLFFAVLEGRKQEHNPEGNVKPFVDLFSEMTLENIPSPLGYDSMTKKSQNHNQTNHTSLEDASITKKSQEDNQKNHTLINNIKALMEERGYTQSSLARAMDKKSVVINRALNGKVKISAKMQMDLADLFSVSVEELNGSVVDTSSVAKDIRGFIRVSKSEIKEFYSWKELKKVYNDLMRDLEERPKEIKQLIKECAARAKKVKSIPRQWTDLDLYRFEEYNTEEVCCWTFRKADDERDEVQNSLGNMCQGYLVEINGMIFKSSESAYIAGLFSDNTKECLTVQRKLVEEESGYSAKKKIRGNYEEICGRKDWETFNVQWMLYVVWKKCLQNESFRDLLLKTYKNSIIIENSAMQTGKTADFWGSKNEEWKQAYKKIEANSKLEYSTDANKYKDKLIKESDAITQLGVYKGVNCMGKILTICRECLIHKTEPSIDYELLRSKHIYINGQEIEF